MSSRLQMEINTQDTFNCPEEVAVLSILRTSDQLYNRFGRLFRKFDLTPSQYNVLRVLRGEGKPIPCLEIASRMIQVVPAITGLIDRLESQQLVQRKRAEDDRRVIYVVLTRKGRQLVDKIDAPLVKLQQKIMKGISKTELAETVRVLERVRDGIAASQDDE
jgi:MarR family 2-MHQ and catechol resistance regulon transcriptional repressor